MEPQNKEFNFWRFYITATGLLVIALTLFFGLVGSFTAGSLFSIFVGVVIISALLGAVITLGRKFSRESFRLTSGIPSQGDILTGRYKGLGGWLILVGVGLAATIILQGYAIFEITKLYSNGSISLLVTYIPGFGSVILFEFLANIGILIFTAYTLFLFFKESRLFPKYFLQYLLGILIYTLADYVWSSFLTFPTEFQAELNQMVSQHEAALVRTVISVLIWGLYIKKSVRVKTTFVS